VHEGRASVARPEGSVAVEYGDPGGECVDAGVEGGCGEALGVGGYDVWVKTVRQTGSPGGIPLDKRITVDAGEVI